MPAARKLIIGEVEYKTLQEMRDHHSKAYLRERAAALLKIADGRSIRWVAEHGLLKPRHRDRVSEWLNRYQQAGLAGLYIRAGRGRKPAFPPRGASGDKRESVKCTSAISA